MNIKNKLTFHFVLLVGTLLLLFSVAIYVVSSAFLEQEFKSRFKEKVDVATDLLIKNGAVDKAVTDAIDKHTLNAILGEKILIIDNSANIHYHSFDGNHHPFNKSFLDEINTNNEAFTSIDDKVWYGKALTIGDKKISMVAEGRRDYLADLAKLKVFLIGGLLFSLLVVFFLGRFFAGKALKPISLVVHEVDEISAKNLHMRVNEGNGSDEISVLAQTFNRLLARLHAAFELQQNFVSNASHELRTPLSTITTQLEITLMNQRNTDEYEAVLHSILEDIRDLNQLSDGLFDLTLASRDESLMKSEAIRIDEALLHSRSELLKRKTDYKINMHFGELPDDEKLLTRIGKEHLLKSTFRNLMDNACKFSRDKTVDVFLSLETNALLVKFIDRGIGIPESYLQKIYTPLMRADNAKGIAGHGLGLALSKKIVELHKGDISVQSKIEEGTTVCIALPVSQA
jgi:signal transduction histidine kinase